MTDGERHRIEAVWRHEAARIVGSLTRLVRDLDLAEQFGHDALVAALEQWPREGTPANPGAWLMATARRRAIDWLRRERREQAQQDALARAAIARQAASPAPIDPDDDLGDDALRLMFLCCHPVLPAASRTALTLRLIAGLTTDEIARAYLVPEPTIAQRIVRAKRMLADAGVPFELPAADGLAARLGSVLEVLYLLFNEGYTVTTGPTWTRADLCEEALRLARVLATQLPHAREVHGLVALMEIQASRLSARCGDLGDPVLLLEQDRTRWNRASIERGFAALARAAALGGSVGPYELQAAIAACHARATSAADTDWQLLVQRYGELLAVLPSPVVALNRAVAVAMAYGPEAGLYLVEHLAREPGLSDYHLLPCVRGELLRRLGRRDEARAEFERAARLTGNASEQALLARRAAACATESG